jgi:heptosyltransferase III
MTVRLGPRVLAVRLDSEGDVILTGPALRRLAAGAGHLDLLVSPTGAAAAALLPGVDDVLVTSVPWAGIPAPTATPAAFDELLTTLRDGRYDECVIFTSYHQSPLPMALLARWAGIPRVVGTSDDYPGTLLDVRHRRMPEGDDTGEGGGHEVEAMCALAEAAGYPLPDGEDDLLRILPQPVPGWVGFGHVVVHPSATAPARAIGGTLAAEYARALQDAGWHVVVTGGPGEHRLGALVTPDGGTDLTGRTTLAELSGVLATAAAVVVGNTGPAHLAAAVGTPVVSVFTPVVPVGRWGPWGVPHVVLGDQQAPCRGSRARRCPVPGHPCVADVTGADVVAAVRSLASAPSSARSLHEVGR